MKNEFKKVSLLLYIAQLVFILSAFYPGYLFYSFGGWINLASCLFLVYMSMNFYGLKIHFGRLISEDLENTTKTSLKLWTDLNRRQRRKLEPQIRKELKNKKNA